MGFYADLHVHSRYSRATSRDADLEHMSCWARRKGVSVLATGDFTHPAWRREIEEKLVPAEPGLFRLRPELERQVDEWLGPAAAASSSGAPPRFMLEVEISTIYKKDGRTRKVHHLLYAPDLEKARGIVASLERIGNLASDGRPILGLDSRDLLEITLEAGEGCYLVPAHIWTPWFAALGSKSGFDSIEECYGDLAPAIFAVETGLSSDPPMNRRLSRLDRYTLVSNSDAHSPPRIGREACVFESEMDYFAMRRALETGEGYGGTVEFFAEEGKYHLDGHRKCGVCLTPEESRGKRGVCHVCGKPLTLGVMHRVDELADRDVGAPAPATRYRSFVPLEEVLAEIRRVGAKSKAVQADYHAVVARLGSELFILENAPIDAVERAGSAVLAEAVARMRDGRVIRQPGYDGEYGVIRLFADGELDRRAHGAHIFDLLEGLEEPAAPPARAAARPASRSTRVAAVPAAAVSPPRAATPPAVEGPLAARASVLDGLDPRQRLAAETVDGPLVVIAGPGTGKTRTMTRRIAYLVAERGAAPSACLAVTFTNRAAGEMAQRLRELLPESGGEVPVMTFHALGVSILREHASELGFDAAPRVATEDERRRALVESLAVSERKAGRLLAGVSRHKRAGREAGGERLRGELARALDAHEAWLLDRGAVDFDDLIALPSRLLESSAEIAAAYRSRWSCISVDEFQDVDPAQYRLLLLLAPPGDRVCVVGDPDQAIYGFRGADAGLFDRFREDFPGAKTVVLERNYRSTRAIVDASLQVVRPTSLVPGRSLEAGGEGSVHVEVHDAASDRAEAELVVHAIERMIGGSAFFSIDSGRVEGHEGAEAEGLAFSDFAVLYRTDAQSQALVEALQRSGMPFQRRSHRPLLEAPGVAALAAAIEGRRREAEKASGGDGAAASERTLDFDALLERAVAAVRGSAPEIDASLPALRAAARRVDGDLDRFLAELALGADVDLWDPRAESVSLLTLHAAKGLEFPVVFITGCEDGVLPLRWGRRRGARRGPDTDASDDATDNPTDGRADPGGDAEERRLFFVGMTRARRLLVLTRARRRARNGKARSMEPSPFLRDIEERLLAHKRHEPSRPRSPVRQLEIFDVMS